MTVLVLGFSISGRASAELLLAKGKQVIAVDRNATAMTALPGIRLFDESALIPWHEVEQLLLSPGVPPRHPYVQEARRRKIEVVGEIEFAFRHLRNPVIGITGTNGKTTVAMLATHILQQSGRKARALGNIGESLSGYALSPDLEELLVVELSSFQLETLEARCLDVAVCLNITPDHLERYNSMLEYAQAKCHIEECLKEGGELYVSRQVEEEFGVLLRNPRLFEMESCPDRSLSSEEQLKLGWPELPNVQAVYPLCRHFGVSDEQFLCGLKSFRKPKHRIEYVGEWNGLDFYNDSKATNIDAVMYAVSLMEGPITLLAGGVDKGASYRPWIEAFGSKVQRIIVFGQAAGKLEEELQESFPLMRVARMQEALIAAVQEARGPMKIVLSPGCSSFDAFRNYEHRGEEFKRMVKEKVWIEEKRS